MFSCFLIGENRLVIQCAEILMENGFNVLGIISDFVEVEHYALQENISFYKSLKDAESTIFSYKIDYFFSVVNHKILPNKLIEHINRLTINYHDAILPGYAGVNATCWAILNDEYQHGITWHVVNEVVDGGDILKQVVFPIEKEDTALSLNLKCHQYAINLFKELVFELKSETYIRTPQNFDNRTYYAIDKKPLGNGWVNWENDAKQIEKEFRAFYLGNYINSFGCLKFTLADRCFIITKLLISSEISTQHPGTIIDILDGKWKIATRTNALIISEVITTDNKRIDLKSLEKHFNIRPGYCLKNPLLIERDFFQNISSELFFSELYWAKKLKTPPTMIPFLDSSHSSLFGQPFNLLYSIDIREQFIQSNVTIPFDVFLLTIWSIYLFRIGNVGEISFALSYPGIRAIPICLHSLVSTSIPFEVRFTEEMTVKEAFECIQRTYSTIKTKKSYLHDILYRYSLEEKAAGIVIVFYEGTELIEFDKFTNFQLLLAVNLTKKTIEFHIPNFLANDIFLIQFIDNVKGHIETLLESIIKEREHEHSIKNIPILTNNEKITLLEHWNNTTTEFPADRTVIEVFENQVKHTPTNFALKDKEELLTYQELNTLANKMARFLLKKEIKREDIIALYSSSNLNFIISMLAILKIGASYIPIDPQISTYNLDIILNESKTSILLISKECQAKFLKNSTLMNQSVIYYIEDCLNLSVGEIDCNLDPRVALNTVAHIIYTSGTTGRPKGVIIPHHAINRLVKNTNYIKIESQDKIILASSISFDASTFEIMGALLNGACLVCVPRSLLLNPNRFAQFLEKEGITILWLTSELFNQYVSINPAMFKKLTYLLVGGDILNPEKIKLTLECPAGSPKNVINGYGPTENTTFTTTFLISKKATKKARIPIGKPISNTTVYVLDKRLNPVPIGVAGHLYTGGKGLSLGYLNNPEITKTKFISNPFSNNSNDKLYNTGDLVRWLPDGNLDYLGREDRQVKIRGLRVELEAVQRQILRYTAINQCFLTVLNDKQKGKLLVAYLVPVKGKEVLLTNLKKFLRKFLPGFMMPNHFIIIDKLPLTPNGKVNAKALPHPSPIALLHKSHSLGNNLQEKLIRLWENLFSIEEIGIHDDFFSLGGTSLLMTRLLMELDNNFSYHLSLAEFFQEPTINGLTKLMTQQQTKFFEMDLKTIHQDISVNLTYLTRILTIPTPAQEKGGIFLTGATGFLGSHLLNDLVKMTQQTIYCLVREKNFRSIDDFINRIKSKYCLTIPKERIVLVYGDLTCSYLGMEKKFFFDLAQKITGVYHNAAYVHHIYSYEQLREANVLGTIEIIKLASVNKAPIHYVSTLSAVLNYIDQKGRIKEELIQDIDSLVVQDGYSQTKLVSEYLLAQAAHNGLSVNIYRPAWILGQEKTGIIEADNNHLLLLIKGCIQMGIFPNWDVKLNIAPVDFISKLIIGIGCENKCKHNVFNIGNNQSIKWSDLVKLVSRYFPTIKIVSANEWKLKLHTLDEQNALFELLPIYLNSSEDWVENLGKISYVNNNNTNLAIKKLGLSYPTMDKDLLDKYITYLIQEGFLPSIKERRHRYNDTYN